MVNERRTTSRVVGPLALVMALAPGCGIRPAGFERYVPEEARANEALDRALAAWKSGGPAKPQPLTDPAAAIEVADGSRRPGQKLLDYQIVGEVSADGPRCFVVRLTLDQPAQQIDTRYYVAGIDPLWVFRQEDYDLIMHWEKCDDETVESSQSFIDAAQREAADSGGGVTR
ncbi:MAG TPA: hypothetical protein VFW87_09380 [Pirellulales bacterium]|nr:hypothetical protein [Pirellulales bacterium]